VIYVGIDDTDIIGSPGTNQVARAILAHIGAAGAGTAIVRHQLLFDPRVPFTSKNGSASIVLGSVAGNDAASVAAMVRSVMQARFVPGSDPGLAVATQVPPAVQAFGRRCQHELVSRSEAHAIARAAGLLLEGLGGTEDGVIGALAAVGLAASGDDGRIVHLAGWPNPDDFGGPQELAAIRARGVDDTCRFDTGEPLEAGLVDVGKRLRPSRRGHRVVLFVEPCGEGAERAQWRAVKLP
jgi:hypothetical protein